MALAVKNTPETIASHLFDRLSVSILAGVVYVLGSLAVVIKLLPGLWWSAFPEGFATWVLLVAVLLAALALLSAIGIWLLGAHPVHGLKAGIFTALAVLLLAALVARGISGLIEQWTFQGTIPQMWGMALAAALSIALVVVGVGWIIRPKTHSYLMTVEDQGWFAANSYKRSQGQLVRRGTIVAVLGLVGCGLYVMWVHQTLATAGNWEITIPFTGKVTIKDPKDAAILLSNLDVKSVRVQSKGDSNLVEGKVVSRSEFEAEKKRVEEKEGDIKPALPTALPVLGRYEFRENVQEKLANEYVKIDKPGDETSPFTAGEVVEKSKFNSVRDDMKNKGKTVQELPTAAKEMTQPDISTKFETMTLLPHVDPNLYLIVAALGFWLAWRLVNVPVFADFLIATEAELNKVSWTTRKRLTQDTIVVLITVAMLAAFILAMDTAWYKLLSWDVIRVLQVDKTKKKPTDLREQPW